MKEAGGIGRKSSRRVTLREYVAEVLKNVIDEKGETLDVVVAEAPDLRGCFTQGASLEEARENLIDVIEVWIMADFKSGDELPVVNGCQLAITAWQGRRARGKALAGAQRRVGASTEGVLGFEGPYPGGKHQWMRQGRVRISVPNPHEGDIDQGPICRMLRQSGFLWRNGTRHE